MIIYKQKNHIHCIRNQHSQDLEDHDNTVQVLSHHFHSVLTKPIFDRSIGIKKVTQCIPNLVLEEQNFILYKEIPFQLVEEVVMSMSRDKAPKHNGFTTDFFQSCWDILQRDVHKVVKDSHCSALLLFSFHATLISLMPESSKASSKFYFWVTTLCNFTYKIILKTIDNRLNPLLPSLLPLSRHVT